MRGPMLEGYTPLFPRVEVFLDFPLFPILGWISSMDVFNTPPPRPPQNAVVRPPLQ